MRAMIALLTASLLLTTTPRSQQPNIVLILADDLGYGDVSCYNDEARVATPNIDRLASEGMRFTDAHSPSTVCTPTRYSVLTGRMAFRLNYRGVFAGAGGPCLIEPERLTLPAMLQQQGFATAMFGKWHVGLTFFDQSGAAIRDNGLAGVQRIDYSRAIPDAPIHRGFDQFFGTACCPTTDWLYAYIDGDRIPVPPTQLLDKSTLPKHPWANDCRRGMVANDFDLEEVDLVFLARSLQFLDQHHKEHAQQPFFLFHSMQAVHLPSFASKQFQGKSKAGPHGDFLLQMDYVVGALLQKLDELGIADNTLVLLTSDNGPEVPTVVNMRKAYQHDGARPWRGMKRDNWEGGHRVPLLARWPGKIQQASTSEQTVCLTDLMATCAAVVSAPLPNDAAEDSFNLLPVLLGTQTTPVREFTLHQTISLALAIRQGDFKYLDHKGSGGNNYQKSQELAPFALPEEQPDAPGQLYNLREDPGETHNLYAQHPDVVADLKAKLDRSKASGRSAPLRNTPAPEAPRCQWPVPGSVVVTDTTTKQGRTAKSRYTLRILQHEDGESLRIRHDGYEFLEVEGQDATNPRMQQVLASATAMAAFVPDYRITNTGLYVETIDLEQMLDRMMPTLLARGSHSPEQAQRLREQFQTPEFQQLMHTTLAKYWQSWVGAWVAFEVDAGKSVEQPTEIDVHGVNVPATMVLTHHGAATEHPGHVRLSLRVVAEGPAVREALIKRLAQLQVPDENGQLLAQMQQLAAVHSSRHLEVITRLDTLQPAWARFELVTRVTETGASEPREQLERHEYTFDWAKPK